jgi:anti-sigma B factor antagonist
MALSSARPSRQVLRLLDAPGSPHVGNGMSPRIVVVTLPAEIDVANGGQVYDALASALCGGTSVLIADATATTFCGGAGVSALIRARHQAAVAGVQLRLAASPAVRRILELTGTSQLLGTHCSVHSALGEPPGATTSVASPDATCSSLP